MTLTATQLVERQRGIGGSDAAAALGLSPWVTARELYDAKTAENPTSIEATEGPMLWGHLLEPLIRQRYSDKTGRVVRVPDTLWSDTYPWMLAHLDGVTDDGRGWEGKTARTADGWGEPGTDAVPQSYLIQVQHCMIVAKLDVFDVSVLIGGSEERQYEVPADRELQELIIDGEAEFWKRVEARDPPPVDLSSPRALDMLRKLYPGTDGSELIADAQDEAFRIVMEEAMRQVGIYQSCADGAKAHLLARMGNAALLKFADGKAMRRKVTTRKGYVVSDSTYVDSRFINTKEK